jgi:predicted Zn finger-like uncharacterized protein
VAIEFKCKNCSTVLRVSDEHLGKQARCPQCQQLNTVQPDPMYINEGDAPVATSNPYAEQPTANPYQPAMQAGKTYQVPHRGGLILTLGILAIVCNIALVPGILAWIMGRSDLRQMKAGVMDREGEGLTQAGMIMGMIMTALAAVAIIFYIGFFILAVLMAAAGNMN